MTRLFYQRSTGKWLRRIDSDIGELLADAPNSCSAAFLIPAADIAVLATDQLSERQRDALTRAVDWQGGPPTLPMPSTVATGQCISPPPAPPIPDSRTQYQALTADAQRIAFLARQLGLVL